MTPRTGDNRLTGLVVRLDEQGLSAHLARNDVQLPPEITADALLEYLAAQRIVVNEQGQADIRQALNAWLAGGGPAEVLVASGRAARHGVDGVIRWSAQCDPDRLKTQHDGQFSHYASQFASVAAGEEFGRLVPPTAGQAGLNVYGQAIPANPGRAAALTAREGCHIDPENGAVIADVSGTVHIRGDEVSVSQFLHITGNVDFATGHVDSPGDVEVDGNVNDLFQVKARGNVVVHGDVQAAQIVANGDLTIQRALANQRKGICQVGGSLNARLVENSVVSVAGNIEISREAIACDLFAGGQISCTGSICGGFCVARGGLSAKALGSNGAVRTVMVVGVDWMLPMQLGPLMDELKAITADLDRRKAPLELLKASLKRLSPQQREQVTQLEFEFMELQARQESLDQKISDLRSSSSQQVRQEISVRGVVHPGVQIRLGQIVADVQRAISGPITFSVVEVRGESSIVACSAAGGQTSLPARKVANPLSDALLPPLPPQATANPQA